MNYNTLPLQAYKLPNKNKWELKYKGKIVCIGSFKKVQNYFNQLIKHL